MQYFYIIIYTIVGDDTTICKVGLNPHQMIAWGRREATRHPERTYSLYRQPITRTGEVKFYKQLNSFTIEVERSLKVVKNNGFNWDAFTASQGADHDIDIVRY